MLTRLEMWCFRKVEHAVMLFEPGITVIRGQNEGGKTTRLEAILYALFGAKALRTPLSATVTHGRKETELKVSLEFGEHTFVRSAKGAEVLKNGAVFITGQTEVTNFAADILGVDASTASKLMLASQGQLRGTLEQGPKATVELIESLADFTLFDRLIEAMQHKLPLGAATPYEEMLAMLKQQLDMMEEPVLPDVAVRDARLREAELNLTKAKETLAASPIEAASARLAALQADHSKAIRLSSERFQWQKRINEQEDRIAQASALATVSHVTQSDIDDIEARLATAIGYSATKWAWDVFNSIPVSDIVWEGDAASFFAELQTQRKLASDAWQKITQAEAAIKIAESQIVTGNCTHCGKDISKLDHVCERNLGLQNTIAGLRGNVAEHKFVAEAASAAVISLERVEDAARKQVAVVSRIQSYVSHDDTQYPPKVVWCGGAVDSKPESPESLRDQLREMNARRDAAAKNAAQREILLADLENMRSQLRKLEDEFVPTVSDEDMAAAAEEVATMRAVVDEAKTLIDLHDYVITTINGEHDAMQKLYDESLKKREALAARIVEVEQNIASLQFNNALLKKVRAARPIVADRLWTMVLSSVSQMFSVMRGERSVVAKDKDGFTVNGQPVSSLSGSTLDILGLALRVALTKTFLPACPFLMLDEPAAAMDQGRTNQMLGFLASAEFSQILLVTHEDVSEQVADNLLEV